MAKWGQQVSWTGRNGEKSVVTVRDYDTPEAALEAALKSAVAFGWTRPRWWQWWRWHDFDYTRTPKWSKKKVANQ